LSGPDLPERGEPLPEGDEAAPPGVRAMAVVRWALVAVAALSAAGAWIWSVRLPSHATASAVATRYRCPMHPAVVQPDAGACPVCGMDLVPVSAGGTAPVQPPARVEAAKGKYWCPMHPDVSSDDPEARCDRCGGMKLLPRDEVASGMPGLVPVDVGAEWAHLIGVRTAEVARRSLRPRVRAPATVTVNESAVALVTSRVTGWIEELPVSQAGQRVEKGQVLATIYSPDLLVAQQVYLSGGARTGGAFPVDPTKRLDLLGIAPQDLAQLAESRQVKNALPIRAPAGGFVARRQVQVRQYVQPGAELFQIADLSTVWVIADVFEEDFRRVAPGQRARLRVSARPGEEFAGTVDLVYPAVSPESRSFQVRVALPNPGMKLRPGMTGEVELDLASADGLAVPADAVVDTGDHQYVFVARDAGRFEPRSVRLGARDAAGVEVVEGLAAGDRVVTAANFLIDSESRLRAAAEQFRASPAGR